MQAPFQVSLQIHISKLWLTFAIPLFHMGCEYNGWSSSSHLWPCTKNGSDKRQKKPGFQMALSLLWTNPKLPTSRFLLGREKKNPYMFKSLLFWVFCYTWPNLILTGRVAIACLISWISCWTFRFLLGFIFIIHHTVILIRCIFRHIDSYFLGESLRSKFWVNNVLIHIANCFSFTKAHLHSHQWCKRCQNSTHLHHQWVVFSLKYCNLIDRKKKVYLYILITNDVKYVYCLSAVGFLYYF